MSALAAAVAGLALSLSPNAGGDVSLRAEPSYQTVAQAWNGLAPCLTRPADVAGTGPAPSGPRGDARIAGFQLVDQPQAELAALKTLIRRTPRARLDAARAAVPDCRETQCAAQALFGAELGPRLLRLAASYGYAVRDVDGGWSPQDLDEIAAALADIRPAWTGRIGYRVVARHDGHGPAYGAQRTGEGTLVAMAGTGHPGILLAPGWSTLNANARRVALTHELGHEFARGQSRRWRQAWRTAMADDRAAAAADGRRDQVSSYAETGSEEDFAESLAAYRYMAPALRRRAPARYAFMRERVFQGVEFGAEAACRAPASGVAADR